MKMMDVTGVLLAGGRSRRMGFEKIFMRVGDEPVARIVADRLLEITDEAYVAANDRAIQEIVPLPIIPDIHPGAGPLAGLHAAFRTSERPWLLVVACDLPQVSVALLAHLCEPRAEYDAVIPVTSDGCLHPACALYHRKCLQTIEENIANGRNRVLDLFEGHGLRLLQWSCRDAGFSDDELMDLDTPEQYRQFQLRFKP